MAIGVRGQFEFEFNLNGRNNIFREDQFNHFTQITRTGGSLPEFELEFTTEDPRLVQELNESSLLQVTVRDSAGEEQQSNLKIVTPTSKRTGKDQFTHRLVGALDQPGYTTNQRIRITDKMSAVDAIKRAAGEYFKVVTDVTSNDQMHWIQHNTSDRRFIYDVLMHMDLPDSFPLIVITAQGEFRLLDVRKQCRGEPRARFGYDTAHGYLLDKEYEIIGQSGIANAQGAYGIEQVERNLATRESFSSTKITQPVKNLLSSASGLNRATDTPTRRLAPVTLTEQMHSNYWEAWRRNIASLMSFSSSGIACAVRNHVVPVQPGDIVEFKDEESDGNATESYSGLYMVAKTAMTVAQRTLVTGFDLVRENMNDARGSLR